MISNRTVIGIIPARGGSKGVPRKNIRLVGGKPLIAWTIEQARQSRLLDSLILSSEDPEIIRIARSYGCEVPFIRPSHLAADHIPGIDVVLHALEQCHGFDYVVLLQPTSPLRSAEDIDTCISLCEHRNAPACVSVTRCQEHPYYMFRRTNDLRLEPLFSEGLSIACRQDLPPVFRLNGAVYVAQCQWLLNSRTFLSPATICFEMPADRSIDIDTEDDLVKLDYQIGSVTG